MRPSPTQRIRRVLTRAYPVAVGLTLALTLVLPDAMNAGVVTSMGLLLGAAALLLGTFVSNRGDNTAVRPLVLATAGFLTWLLVTSLMAEGVRISLVGRVGQHAGAALFLLSAAWIAAGYLVAEAWALRASLAVVSGAGTIFGVATLYEALTSGASRVQGSAAGFFENSMSLGEFLAVAALASLIGALVFKSSLSRMAAAGAGVTALIAMAVADSRVGFVGLLVAVAVAFVHRKLHASERAAAYLGVAAPTAGVVITAVLVAASLGRFGVSLQRAVSLVGTDRDAIWRSAVAQLKQSPLVGSGVEQFSAWITWTLAEGNFQARAANDPHNIYLAITLGAGVVGLLLFSAVVGLLLQTLSRALGRSRGLATSLLVAFPTVLLTCGLFAWLSPAAVLATSAIVGASLGTAFPLARETASRSAWKTAASIGLGAVALAVSVVGLAALPAERSHVANSLRTADVATAFDESDAYSKWPDPAYAAAALRALNPALAAGDGQYVQLAEDVLEESSRDAEWDANLAGAQMLALNAEAGQGEKSFRRFTAVARRGRKADPTSGLWSALCAVRAEQLGLQKERRQYAEDALEFTLDDGTRSLMQEFAR